MANPTWEETTPVESSDVPKWEDTTPVEEAAPRWEDTAPVEEPGIIEGAKEFAKKLTSAKEWTKNEWVSDKELTELSKKHGVSKEYLGSVLDLNMAARELSPEEANVPGYLAGLARRIAGLPNVAFNDALGRAYRQYAYDEKHQKAADEAIKLGNDRKNFLESAGELVLPGGVLGKQAAAALKTGQILKGAALSAPTGAIMGYGGSTTGKEVEGALTGATMAAALPLGVQAAFASAAGLGKAAGKISEYFEKKSTAKLEAMADKYLDEASSVFDSIKEVQADIAAIESRADEGKKLTSKEKTQLSILEDELSRLEEKQASLETKASIEQREYNPMDELPAYTKHDLYMNSMKAYERNLDKENILKESFKQYVTTGDIENPYALEFLAGGEGVFNKIKKQTAVKLGADLENPVDEWEVTQVAAKKLLDVYVTKLARVLDGTATRKNSMSIIQDFMKGKGLGEEGVFKAFDTMRAQHYLNREAASVSALDRLSMVKQRDWEDRYIDVYDVLTKIDDKWGYNLAENANTMINKLEKIPTQTIKAQEQAKELIQKISRVSDLAGEEGGRLISEAVGLGQEGASRAAAAGLIDRETYLISRDVADRFEEWGEYFNKAGLNFPMMKAADGTAAYFPVKMKSANEVRRILKAEAKELLPSVERKLSTKSELSQREQDFMKGLEIAGGNPIQNAQQLNEALGSLDSGNIATIKRLGLARMTLQRKGEVPSFLREYDVGKLLNTYIQDGFKQLALRDHIGAFKNTAEALRKSGDIPYAEYLDSWISDILSPGEKSMFRKGIENIKSRYSEQVLKLEREKKALIEKEFAKMPKGFKPSNVGDYLRTQNPRIEEIDGEINKLRFKEDAPELLAEGARSLFHAKLLGGNIKQALHDMIQPYSMGAAEIGGKYGADKLFNATLGYLTNPKSLKAREAELIERGIIAPDFAGMLSTSREMVDMKNQLAKYGREGVGKLSALYNWMRRSAEIINRSTMLNASKEIAADFMRGDKGGIDFVAKRLGSSYRDKIREMQRKGTLNQENLTNLIADDLITKTQFRYHPSMKSEMARELGPLLTQFSHYPSSVLGSLTREYRTKGAKAAAYKALAPVFALGGIGMAYDTLTEEGTSPREKALQYKSGIVSRGAPIISAVDFPIVGKGPIASEFDKLRKLMFTSDWLTSKDTALESMFSQLGKVGMAMGDNINPIGPAKRFYEDMYRLVLDEEPPKEEDWD